MSAAVWAQRKSDDGPLLEVRERPVQLPRLSGRRRRREEERKKERRGARREHVEAQSERLQSAAGVGT